MESSSSMKTDAEEAPLVSGEDDPNAAPADDQPPPPPPPSDGGKGRILCLILKAVCLVLLIVVIGLAYGAFFCGYPYKRMTQKTVGFGGGEIDPKIHPLKKVCEKKINDSYYEDLACPFFKGGMYLEAANLVFTMIVLGLVIFAIVAEVKKMPAAQKVPTLMLVGGVLLILGAILEIASACLTSSNTKKTKDAGLKILDNNPVAKTLASKLFDEHVKALGMKTGVKYAAGIIGVIAGIVFIVSGVMGLRAAKKEAAEVRASQGGGGGDADPFPQDALSAPDQRQSQSQSQQ